MQQPIQSGAPERYLSVEELADYMQLTQDTVRRLARNGTLPSLKVGRQFRFLVSSVVEKLQAKESPREGGL